VRTPPLVAGLVVALALGGASGCGQVGENITKREVVVHFGPDAPRAQHVAARQACAGLPHTSPEPMPTGTLRLSQRVTDVRFRVDDANDRELLALYNCLQKQPGVVGVDIPSVQ
jgi:hypothetical protein